MLYLFLTFLYLRELIGCILLFLKGILLLLVRTHFILILDEFLFLIYLIFNPNLIFDQVQFI